MVGELNFNLLDQNLPAKTAGSIMGAFQAGQDRDQANALAQSQLQDAQSKSALSRYTLQATQQGAEDIKAVYAQMRTQGFDPANPQHLQKLDAMPGGAAITKGIREGLFKDVETQGKQADNAKKAAEDIAQRIRDAANRPDDENLISHNRDIQASPLYSPEQKARVQQMVDKLVAMPYDQRKAAMGNPGQSAGEVNTAQSQAATLAQTVARDTATAEDRKLQRGIQQQQVNVSGRNATESNRHNTTMEGIAATKAAGLSTELAPKEIQKREAVYPKMTAALKGATAENTQLIKDLTTLRDHPGLDGMTGTIYGRLPSAKGPSKAARALFDKIMARGGFQKLTEMRQASPTGAALGPVSDSEGKYLRAAFGALDPNQDPADFQNTINDTIAELESSSGRLQEAYDMTYEYKTPAAKPPGPGGGLSPAEQAELDALRKQLGKK